MLTNVNRKRLGTLAVIFFFDRLYFCWMRENPKGCSKKNLKKNVNDCPRSENGADELKNEGEGAHVMHVGLS